MFGFPFSEIIAYSGLHFLLSGSVALLVYWWTWTTYLRIWPGIQLRTTGFSMRRALLLVSLSFALAAHIAEDYLIGWF